jgi:stearoyl-CoA desaturase (delta-9 desaturase)
MDRDFHGLFVLREQLLRHDTAMTCAPHNLTMSSAPTSAAAPVDCIAKIQSIPFIGLHVVALVGAFVVPFHWSLVAWAVATYYVRMFGITGGYHRYFAHRTYKTGRVFQFILAFLGTTSVQKGVLWWAAHHRDHHKYSDQPEDIHSPVQRGFWWSHVGWILASRYEATKFERIRDFAKYPELRWLNKYHLIPPLLAAAGLYAIGGWPMVVWAGFISTVFLWHGTFTINSLSHVFGSTRYKTSDASKNNWLLALITMGEGWHNNHHYYMSSTNQGFFWWEVDLSYYTLRVLSWLGIVWDLRVPPKHIRDAHLVDKPIKITGPQPIPLKEAA